jgi:thioredoxin reductase (NADPH)
MNIAHPATLHSHSPTADGANERHAKLLIIGSGPAGFTAAIYAARANLHPVVLEGFVDIIPPGGQLMITTDVENFPGFPDGIQGPELMAKMRAQAERFGTRLIQTTVSKVDLSKRPYVLESDEGRFSCDALILATGAAAQWLNIPSEVELRGYGVSACATCDGFFFKDLPVAVIGGGDTALEEAHYLAKMCSKVTVVHRRAELRASKIMQERAFRNPKIEFSWNKVVDEVVGEVGAGGVTGLRLKDSHTGALSTLDVKGVFVAIGHKPNVDLVRGQLELDEAGYIACQPGTTLTSVPGVFACGDVVDHSYRQAITAAGTGCMAALDAERFLSQHFAL